MRIYFFRHAIAEDKSLFAKTGRPDSDRPLVERGKTKFKRIVKHLHQAGVTVDTVVTSPYKRARQTADILLDYYPQCSVMETALLTKTNTTQQLVDLISQSSFQHVAVVGHEPFLSSLCSELLLGSQALNIDFKKGSVLAMDFSAKVILGGGVLKWYFTPALCINNSNSAHRK